jgi:hypothetical protein
VVAILSLEIVGVPETAQDRSFPWPKPRFAEPSDEIIFQVRSGIFLMSRVFKLFPHNIFLI